MYCQPEQRPLRMIEGTGPTESKIETPEGRRGEIHSLKLKNRAEREGILRIESVSVHIIPARGPKDLCSRVKWLRLWVLFCEMWRSS